MLPRTTTPLVVTYILLIGAGFLFLETPPPTLTDSSAYSSLLTVWAMFYIAGGTVALTATALRIRRKIKHLASLWHFEIAGLSLIVAANLIYSYALLRVGLNGGEYNYIALSLVISAFASSFVGRVFDALKLIKAVNAVSLPREDKK